MIIDLERFGEWLKLQGKLWYTRKTYLGVLNQWSSLLNGASPTREAAEEFLNYEGNSGKAESSLRVYLSALRLYFRWRGEPGDLNFSPNIAERLKEHYRKNYLYADSKPIRVSGKRPKPELCELCKKDFPRLSYHHWDNEDYSKGLWLCWRCHSVAEAADDGITTDEYLKLKREVKVDKLDEIRYKISQLVLRNRDELQ